VNIRANLVLTKRIRKGAMVMTPGATPTHFFNLPISTDEVAALRITYEESGKTVLQKEMEDCELKDKQIIVKLSQEDTLKFGSNVIVRMQVKVRTTGGDVLVSEVIKKSTNIVLDKEKI
jgi:hypothetical protein